MSKPSRDPSAEERPRTSWRARLPRLETLILLFALILTVGSKVRMIRYGSPPSLPVAAGDVALIDVSVILAVYVLTRLCYLFPLRGVLPRLSIILSLAVALWSIADATWMFSVGVPLRLEVLGMLLHDAQQSWPILWSRVQRAPWLVLAGTIVSGLMLGWIVWRVIRPVKLRPNRRLEFVRMGVCLGLALGLVGLQRLCQQHTDLGYVGLLLRQSTHIGLAHSLFSAGWGEDEDTEGVERQIPRVNERQVRLPPDDAVLPNIVIVFMESVGYWSTTLSDPSQQTTPVLRALAGEGVEFVTTRAEVTRTPKSLFAALTGVSPSTGVEKTEGVLVDPPYESLATILARCGYRAGFFQTAETETMFPAMFANLGFQQFWGMENFEDPSVRISYVAGDDFRMLEPAFAWAGREPGPYLLAMMTSVGHDPYVVPAWFGKPRETAADNFLQCVAFTDAFLGEVRKRIEALVDNRPTLLCVISDHGEGFRFQHSLWGHLELPFEEALRVPWVIWWPGTEPWHGKVQRGTRIETACHILDVTPTLLALVGFEVSEAGFEGADALGPLDPNRRHFFSGWQRGAPAGYVEGTDKYVYTRQMGNVVRYDLAADPMETSPIALEGAEADRVRETIQQWRRERRVVFPPNRYMERLLFDHWESCSLGMRSWAYYVP